MKVKVRIAPSPTGFFHVGNARTALFNWLFARHHGGEFILRIEDTDLERSKKEYEEDILSSLEWLGLNWDGPVPHQTERLDIYEKYLKQLLDSGKAFWCGHSKEELDAESKSQIVKREAPRHICEYKKAQSAEGIIRLAVDENSTRAIRFDDEIRGTIEWEERLLGDISLAKDLRTPLYNFAVVIDDFEMEISHVIRGEDHISNTPKQILIYEALGKPIPKFAHLPLILGPNRSKLSSRHGAVSVNGYKKDYLPEAMVNFMGFLGYTYDKDILTVEEMVREFELKKVHKSGAVFNIEKLNWTNSQYIRRLSPQEFKNLTNLQVSDAAVPLITERLEKLSDARNFDYFWKEPEYDKDLLIWKNSGLEDVKKSLEFVVEILLKSDFNRQDLLRKSLDELGKKLGNRGLAYWPFRVALTGKEKSPDPVDVAVVLSMSIVLKRIKVALKKL